MWSDDGTYSSCSLASSPNFTRRPPQTGQGNSSGGQLVLDPLAGQILGEPLPARAPPVPTRFRDLRPQRLLGGRLHDAIGGLVGEQAQLVGVDALPPGAELAAEELLDLVIQLLDPPLRLPNRLRLLADDLVAEPQVVGQRCGGLALATIVRPPTTSKRALSRILDGFS